jgi:hypothetical protein
MTAIPIRRHGPPIERFSMHASSATPTRDQGKRSEARDLLAPVCNWFTEGFDTPVLQEAKTLLDELSADPSAGMGGGLAPAPASSRNVTYDLA